MVDAHDLSAWADVRPDLVTPNAREAYALIGHDAALSRVDGLLLRRELLFRATGAQTVVVTLDRDGSLLLGQDLIHRTYAVAQPEQQASGAGDTFVAALTSAKLAGLAWPDAVELAQAAADVVVHRFGTSVCSTADLAATPDHRGEGQVLETDDLLVRIEAERTRGRRIVLTNGCFDVLHRGHTTSLARAAALGDVLVVAVNSDDSTRRLKGPHRPINSELDRAAVLAALACVDYVVIFDTDTRSRCWSGCAPTSTPRAATTARTCWPRQRWFGRTAAKCTSWTTCPSTPPPRSSTGSRARRPSASRSRESAPFPPICTVCMGCRS